MTFDEYHQAARATAMYPQDLKLIYPALGLAGETGEVVDHIKKVIRDNNREVNAERRELIAKELGDVLWYMASIAADLGMTLNEVAELNIKKLKDRAERGVLRGAGDNR